MQLVLFHCFCNVSSSAVTSSNKINDALPISPGSGIGNGVSIPSLELVIYVRTIKCNKVTLESFDCNKICELKKIIMYNN